MMSVCWQASCAMLLTCCAQLIFIVLWLDHSFLLDELYRSQISEITSCFDSLLQPFTEGCVSLIS